jgi:hypothetical protein
MREIRISSHVLLSFDISRELNALRLRVFKRLRGMDAEMVHQSLWRSENLKNLLDIALLIHNHGGSVRILEEKFIF